jgi:hypothetical protein
MWLVAVAVAVAVAVIALVFPFRVVFLLPFVSVTVTLSISFVDLAPLGEGHHYTCMSLYRVSCTCCSYTPSTCTIWYT